MKTGKHKQTKQVKSVDGRWLDLASTYRYNKSEKYRVKPIAARIKLEDKRED